MANKPGVLEQLRDRLDEIFGEPTAASVWSSLSQPKAQTYWLNPLQPRPDSFTPFGKRLEGFDGAYHVDHVDRESVIRHAGASDGWLYPINPSSLLAVRVLDARKGEEVLDLAAAPGGKTLGIAASMHNTGRIAAVEVVKARFHRLRANLERCGVTNTAFYLADGRSIGRKVPERFDRVLLDAPCSSEARIRLADPTTYAHWKPRKIRETARKQVGLLRSAFRALKPGGVLVYCTCAFAPQENELVVDALLRSGVDAEIEPIDAADVPSLSGFNTWQDKNLDPRIENAVRVLPNALWDGFFICRLRKG